MPVYKLGPSENGGFRSILPPDPEPGSKAGTVLGYALAVAIGAIGGALACAAVGDGLPRSHEDRSPTLPVAR